MHIKKILLLIIAVLFPWLAFLILDNPVSALIAIILQLSMLGWIPAAIWACREVLKAYPAPAAKKRTQK